MSSFVRGMIFSFFLGSIAVFSKNHMWLPVCSGVYGGNVYVTPPPRKTSPSPMPRGPPNCAAQQNWPERFGNISPHLPRLYKRRRINNVSVEGAALHMKVSWLSSPRCRKWGSGRRGGRERKMEMIALQAGKMHAGVENPSADITLFNPVLEKWPWRGGGERARPRSALEHNKPAFFSFFSPPPELWEFSPSFPFAYSHLLHSNQHQYCTPASPWFK